MSALLAALYPNAKWPDAILVEALGARARKLIDARPQPGRDEEVERFLVLHRGDEVRLAPALRRLDGALAGYLHVLWVEIPNLGTDAETVQGWVEQSPLPPNPIILSPRTVTGLWLIEPVDLKRHGDRVRRILRELAGWFGPGYHAADSEGTIPLPGSLLRYRFRNELGTVKLVAFDKSQRYELGEISAWADSPMRGGKTEGGWPWRNGKQKE